MEQGIGKELEVLVGSPGTVRTLLSRWYFPKLYPFVVIIIVVLRLAGPCIEARALKSSVEAQAAGG